MKKNINNYFEEEKIRKERIEKMLSNTDYIKWLITFTQNHDGFTSDEWQYYPKTIGGTDYKNISYLRLFYRGIDEYAKSNYIYPNSFEYGNIYKIRLADVGFEIGILKYQKTIFFCRRALVDDKSEFIDFNDVILGKRLDNVNEIDNDLNKLYDLILTINKNGVPVESIINTSKSAIAEIRLKKEQNQKILLKK